MTQKHPDPVDIHVGSRVRQRRILCGISQTKLGNALGLTFQQIQKYERGANRIGSSRLYQISQILTVPVSFFFDDMPAEITGKATGRDKATDTGQLTRRETLELVRAYYRIEEPTVRKKLFEMVKVLGRSE